MKLSGIRAWWLYRSYYLYQLPRLKRKVQVLTDWNLAMVFRRDIVQQDISRSERTSRAHYETGQIILQQGELARNFYIILKGRVQVFREKNGEETEVAALGAGEFFGEMALLREIRRTASVRALTPVDLLGMDGADFTAIAASSIRFNELLAGVMRERTSGTVTTEPSESAERSEGSSTMRQ